MQVASYYYAPPEGNNTAGNHYARVSGQVLPRLLDPGAVLHPLKVNTIQEEYDPQGYADVAYCQLRARPTRRPAKFIYTFLTDQWRQGSTFRAWVREVKPSLVICQNGVHNAGLEDKQPYILPEFCSRHGTKIIHLPFFVGGDEQPKEKTIPATAYGAIHGAREWLTKEIPHVPHGCRPYQEYLDALAHSRYCVTGGVYGMLVLRYMEAAVRGCCIITNDFPDLDKFGFVHNETCIKVHDAAEVPGIIASPRWQRIGANAREMVLSQHTAKHRAEVIRKEIQCAS